MPSSSESSAASYAPAASCGEATGMCGARSATASHLANSRTHFSHSGAWGRGRAQAAWRGLGPGLGWLHSDSSPSRFCREELRRVAAPMHSIVARSVAVHCALAHCTARGMEHRMVHRMAHGMAHCTAERHRVTQQLRTKRRRCRGLSLVVQQVPKQQLGHVDQLVAHQVHLPCKAPRHAPATHHAINARSA